MLYVVFEYVTYLAIVSVLAGLFFGASALAIITKDKAPRLAEASIKALEGASHRLDNVHLRSLLPQHSPDQTRKA